MTDTLDTLLSRQDSGILLLCAAKNIRCAYLNAAGAGLLQLPQSPQGKCLPEVCAALEETDFAALESLIYRCANTFCCDELTCRRQDGRWLRLRALPVSRTAESAALILLTLTEAAEEPPQLLQKLKEKKRDLLHNPSRPITYEVDLITRTLILSDAFRLLFDARDPILQSEEELPAACRCVYEKDLPVYRRTYREMRAGAPDGSLRIRLRSRLTGSFVHATLLWKNVFDDRGRPIRAVGVVQLAGKSKKTSSAALISNLQLRLELQDSYLKHTNEYLQELRRYRHDRTNNVIALKAFLMHGDTRSALEYLGRMGEALKSSAPIIDTGNPAIDAVITEKLAAAKRLGVTITHTVGFQPGLQIDMMDLTIAAGSCLDNAVEACSRALSAGVSAFLELRFVEQRGALIFKLRNSSVPPAGGTAGAGLPETTKGDKANHGFGLRNVQRIVKKYGGQLILTPGPNDFTTAFTLFLQ